MSSSQLSHLQDEENNITQVSWNKNKNELGLAQFPLEQVGDGQQVAVLVQIGQNFISLLVPELAVL